MRTCSRSSRRIASARCRRTWGRATTRRRVRGRRTSARAGDVTITVANAAGQTVRTLRGTRNAGINRVMWDLRDEPTPEVRLRVSPMYSPNVVIPPEGWPGAMTGRLSILQPPGTYTVKLAVGGREYTRQLVEIGRASCRER